MTANGILYQLSPLVPHISGKGFGLLPTPTASSYGRNKSKGGKERPSLETMARRGLFPTPKARDWKDCGSPSDLKRSSPSISALAGGARRLNLNFIEWMMGLPKNHTEIKE